MISFGGSMMSFLLTFALWLWIVSSLTRVVQIFVYHKTYKADVKGFAEQLVRDTMKDLKEKSDVHTSPNK